MQDKEVNQSELDRVLEEQVNAMLIGKMKPPSEIAAHAVKRLTEVARQIKGVAIELQDIKKKAEMLAEKGVRLNGARDTYKDDIKAELLRLAEEERAEPKGDPDVEHPVAVP